jgi:hypothetical protein
MVDRRYQPINDPKNPFFVGDHKVMQFTVFIPDSDEVEDITGWTFKWDLRVDETEEEVLIHKEGADFTIAMGTDGVVMMECFHEDTVNLDGGNYAHALARTNAGEEGICAYGPLVLVKAATS